MTLTPVRRLRAPLAIAWLLAGGAAGNTVHAQESRFRVLVPPLTSPAAKQGQQVAELVRTHIDGMHTHAPVAERDMKAALRQLKLKPEQAGCAEYRQLMSALNAQVAMCGSIDAGGQVAAQFFNVDGTAFDVPPFALVSAAQAAEEIGRGFATYIRLLQVVTYCDSDLRSGQMEEALRHCEEVIRLSPKNTRALYGRGSALASLNRLAEALAAYQQVLALEPANQDALLAAALTAGKLEQPDVSMRYLNEYLVADPKNTSVRLNIAAQLAKDGAAGAALALLEAAPPQDTTNPMVREYAGHFAMSAAARSLNSDPPGTAAANAAFEKALHHYSFVAAVHGDTTPQAILRNIMIAHGNLGHLDDAIAWGMRAVQQKDADAATWSAHADNLRGANRLEESLAALDRMRQLDTTAEVQTRRAYMLLELGRVQDAVAAIRSAAATKEMTPSQIDGLASRIIRLGFDNHQKAKRFQQAHAHYEAARSIAVGEAARAMGTFYIGFAIYEEARALQDAETVASAKKTLPMFQRARTLIEAAGAFTAGNATLGKARAEAITALGELIERQQAIIRSGG